MIPPSRHKDTGTYLFTLALLTRRGGYARLIHETMEFAMKYAILTLLASCAPSYAQQLQCGPTDDVYAALTDKYGETRQLWAQNGPDQVVEFWGGSKGWTMIITTDDGQSCMVGEGADWGMMPSEAKPNL